MAIDTKKTETPKVKRVPRDNWLQKNWRPVAAYVYMLICLSDFVFMPAWYQFLNAKNERNTHIELALKFNDTTAQVEAMKMLTQHNDWKPITLDGTGMVHLSFLTILGVAAWTRGQEKVKKIENAVEEEADEQKTE